MIFLMQSPEPEMASSVAAASEDSGDICNKCSTSFMNTASHEYEFKNIVRVISL